MDVTASDPVRGMIDEALSKVFKEKDELQKRVEEQEAMIQDFVAKVSQLEKLEVEQAARIEELLVEVSKGKEMEMDHSTCVTRMEQLQSTVTQLIASKKEQQITILQQQDTIHKFKGWMETVQRVTALAQNYYSPKSAQEETNNGGDKDADMNAVEPTMPHLQEKRRRHGDGVAANTSHPGFNCGENNNSTMLPKRINDDADVEIKYEFPSNCSVDGAGDFDMHEIDDNHRDEPDNMLLVAAQDAESTKKSVGNQGEPSRPRVEPDSSKLDSDYSDERRKIKTPKKTSTQSKKRPPVSSPYVRPEKGDPNRHIHHGIKYELMSSNNEGLSYNSYKYIFHSVRAGGETYWRCSRYAKHSCRASLLVAADGAPIKAKPHDHLPPINPSQD